jgi:hypothetical protein
MEVRKLVEAPTIKTHVDVRLVGFNGDGNLRVRVSEANFMRYINAIFEDPDDIKVVHPEVFCSP